MGREFLLKSSYTLKKASSAASGIAELEGVLSTSSPDTEDEEISIEGMDITRLNSGLGQLNWWHLGMQNPSMIVGLFDSAEKIDHNSKVVFKAHLLNTENGRAVLELMKALEDEGKNIGVSVEGKTVKRDGNRILESVATGGALATDQINKEYSW